jgi:hypothetical protein
MILLDMASSVRHYLRLLPPLPCGLSSVGISSPQDKAALGTRERQAQQRTETWQPPAIPPSIRLSRVHLLPLENGFWSEAVEIGSAHPSLHIKSILCACCHFTVQVLRRQGKCDGGRSWIRLAASSLSPARRRHKRDGRCVDGLEQRPPSAASCATEQPSLGSALITPCRGEGLEKVTQTLPVPYTPGRPTAVAKASHYAVENINIILNY